MNAAFASVLAHTVARKATSFFVVPEIPLIGTAGASIAMFAGLAAKMKRKPQV